MAKFKKDIHGIHDYVTEHRKFKLSNRYPSPHSSKVWILEYNNETKYFKTKKEAVLFVESLNI